MKISIITTCFNRENTIRDTIESVLAQDYEDIEYIIIDGASTDRSLSIINEYKSRIAVILSEPDKGMYDAINKGLKQATGEVVGLLHSDDFYYNNQILSQIAQEINRTQAEILYGNGLFIRGNDKTKIVRNWISGAFDRKNLGKGWLPLHPTVYLKRDLLELQGYYDESFMIAADSDFLVRYLSVTDIKIVYLNSYIVYMRMGGLSTSFSKSFQKWKEDIRLYKKNGFSPYSTTLRKILSKIPQFIRKTTSS